MEDRKRAHGETYSLSCAAKVGGCGRAEVVRGSGHYPVLTVMARFRRAIFLQHAWVARLKRAMT